MPDPSDSTAPVPKAPAESAPGPASAAAGKPGPAGLPAEPLVLVPRSRSASAGPKEDAAAPGPEGPPASFTDLMQWMKMFAAASAAPPEEATQPGNRQQRTILPREQRKFQRFDREPGTPDGAPAPAPPASGTTPESRSTDERSVPPASVPVPAEDDRASTPASRPVPLPLTGGTIGRRPKPAADQPRLWLALEVGAVALLVVVFLLGRASVQKAVPSPEAAPGTASGVLSPEAAKMIDEAMAARAGPEGRPGHRVAAQGPAGFPAGARPGFPARQPRPGTGGFRQGIAVPQPGHRQGRTIGGSLLVARHHPSIARRACARAGTGG